MAETFGGGFWDLANFTLQASMVVLTGCVVATSPPVARIIERIAMFPSTPRGSVAFVALLSCLVSMLNWGLSLVFSGLLARAIARRTDLRSDYRALGAAAYLGLGSVWALGLSSSAAQLQATPASLSPELLQTTGVLDFAATILTWQSLTMAAVLIALSVAIAWASAPRGAAIRTAEDMNVDLSDRVDPPPPRGRPGEWLEYSRILPILGLLTLGWLANRFLTLPFLVVISSLNGYLLVFLILGLVLHGTPRGFRSAVSKAVPTTAGVLVQFPLYAAMAAILTRAPGRGDVTVSEHLADLFTSVGDSGGFAIVVALYTTLLGLLVPSGGGKWLVEAPYVMQSATDVGMNSAGPSRSTTLPRRCPTWSTPSSCCRSSLGYVLAKRWTSDVDVLASTSWQLIAGGATLVAPAVVWEGAPPSIDVPAALAFVYVVVVATALAFVCWFAGLRHLPAGAVGVVGLLNPITGVLLGTVLASEPLTTRQWLGLGVACLGVAIAQVVLGDRRSAPPAPSGQTRIAEPVGGGR